MYKVLVLIAIIFSVFLIGCSPQGEKVETNYTVNTNQEIFQSEKSSEAGIVQSEKSSEIEIFQSEEPSESEIFQSEEGKEQIDPILILNIGDTIVTDKKEIMINKVELTYDVLPDDVSGYYLHYEADEGKVFIHIDTDVKNLQKQNLDTDKIMVVNADYNDGYMYTAFPAPEDPTRGFTILSSTKITPLETLGIHYLIDCPQEVAETHHPLFLIFRVDGKDYKYTIR